MPGIIGPMVIAPVFALTVSRVPFAPKIDIYNVPVEFESRAVPFGGGIKGPPTIVDCPGNPLNATTYKRLSTVPHPYKFHPGGEIEDKSKVKSPKVCVKPNPNGPTNVERNGAP